MEKTSFFKTKAGGLTIAFLVMVVAFVVILAGLNMGSQPVYLVGFLMILAAMLYAPVKVFILDRNKK